MTEDRLLHIVAALVVVGALGVVLYPRWRFHQFDAWCKARHFDGACPTCVTPAGDRYAICVAQKTTATGAEVTQLEGKDSILEKERHPPHRKGELEL